MKQAIYREFRPKDFDHVVGQDHIVEILKNQIQTGNIGHAYLFSGIRGTGKTSCAKIFSRAVNCLNLKDGNPCNECENCKMILQDKALEVVEMDAASNRRIDDIRDLKEKVIYPPQVVKYKVYIIDEAHMITTEGFNALLKILEEPPKHLIFILATTEIEKIPDTIISRCQRFEFKRIGNEKITENINYILNKINVEIEQDGINLISELSSGAMRDALSLLDQVVATGKDKISIEDINLSLGLVNTDMLFDFSEAFLENSKSKLLEKYRNLVNSGKTPYNIISDFIKHFRNIMLVKSVERRLTNLNDVEYNKYFEQAQKFKLNELIYILENFLNTEEKMKKSDMQNSLAELLIIKLLNFKAEKSELEKRVETLEKIISSGSLNTIKAQDNSFEKTENKETNVVENKEPEKQNEEKNEVKNNSKSTKNDDLDIFDEDPDELYSIYDEIMQTDFGYNISNETSQQNIETKNNIETVEKKIENPIESKFQTTEQNVEEKISENIENSENKTKTEDILEEKAEEINDLPEEINLMSFKDVVKETIFKKTVSKLFEESVKDIIYLGQDNFLQIDCKEYLFKFGSYKLDEHNSVEIRDEQILKEFFTRVNLPVRKSLRIFANFVS